MAEATGYEEGQSFPGVIGRTLETSQAAWPSPSLRYRNFHTTSLCTPSRACLLTGRNHHANGTGTVTPTGFPGYNLRTPRANGFLSEMLRANGYATFALGKWHLTPPDEIAPGASRRHWPLSRGFDRYYGFLGAATDQYHPELVHDSHFVNPSHLPADGYHLNEDMADRAIEFLTDLRAVEPEKPFFMYYCPGAVHAPHHVPKAWPDRYRGRFDEGWERWRERTFERQVELGIVPGNTVLSPRPEWIASWDACSADERRLFARQMEVYAGFLSHTDHHIGRLIAFLEEVGELDNTLVLIASDNGAAGEGGPRGALVFSQSAREGPDAEVSEDDVTEPMDGDAIEWMRDAWGGPDTYPIHAWGWGWAGNTPLRRWKRHVHEGGVADPLIVHWPRGIGARGEIRGQYAHVTDITPTVLDVLNIMPPRDIDGIPQSPLQGVSFAHTFESADAPTRKRTQYYEMLGSRAIWSDGWKAVTEQEQGVELTEEGLARQRWELYHVDEDFSESTDLAARHPEKLSALIDLWWVEAGKHNVLPLDSRLWGRDGSSRRRRDLYVYRPGGAPIPGASAPALHDRDHVFEAVLEIPSSGAEGVILSQRNRLHGGYSLYVRDGHLHYVIAGVDGRSARVRSAERLPSGSVALALRFRESEDRLRSISLSVNGRELERWSVPMLLTPYGYRRVRLSCGYDAGAAGSDDYDPPFPFTGTLRCVTVRLA